MLGAVCDESGCGGCGGDRVDDGFRGPAPTYILLPTLYPFLITSLGLGATTHRQHVCTKRQRNNFRREYRHSAEESEDECYRGGGTDFGR